MAFASGYGTINSDPARRSSSTVSVGDGGGGADSDDLPLIRDNVLRSLSKVDYAEIERSEVAGEDFRLDSGGGDARRTLTTFTGVFCSVIVSMFSALLFLRLGFVVGQAGIAEAALQFCLAYAIVIFTVLSISAISTNGAVEGGGAYFMISRALGPEFGGSIGLLFFVANICAGALYVAGCIESLISAIGPGGSLLAFAGANERQQASGWLPDSRWLRFFYGCLVTTLDVIISLVGASLFARAALVFVAVMGVSVASSLISFLWQEDFPVLIPPDNHVIYSKGDLVNGTKHYARYTGLHYETFMSNFAPNYTIDYQTGHQMDFASVFAILFTGVTGIMTGANMSGDLKDPAKSIPRGTLSALACTMVVYTSMAILIGSTCSNMLLKNDYLFLQDVNFLPIIVVLGTFGAACFSSLSNLMGASRVLEAIARDRLFGSVLDIFTRTTSGGNPIFAVLLSYVMMMIVLLIPFFNQIATISSVFFLLSYACVNLACLAMELASAPNWRPSFAYFSWHSATFGVVGCIIMMILISAAYSALSTVLMLLLMIALHFWTPEKNWGSISQALIFHQVRKYLLMLDGRKAHVKFWRPQVLLLVSNPGVSEATKRLIDFVNDLKKGGLYVIGHVKIAQWDAISSQSAAAADPVQDEYPYWLNMVDRLHVKAFVEITMAKSVRDGFHHLAHISGLGGMKPNTIVLGFPHNVDVTSESIPDESPILLDDIINGDDSHRGPHLSAHEFVALLNDCRRMRKNLCVARAFGLLDKPLALQSGSGRQSASSPTPGGSRRIGRRRRTCYIDVWPIDFTKPQLVHTYDSTALFMLQLACIVAMTASWKKRAWLRVFLPIAAGDHIDSRHVQLSNMLRVLRINAHIQRVEWDAQLAKLGTSAAGPSRLLPADVGQLPIAYLQSIQDMVREHVGDSVMTFLYLPTAPIATAHSDPELIGSYMRLIDILSNVQAPVILVNAMHIVTTTML